jgi:hypothetical protein
MGRPSLDLMVECFPGVTINQSVEKFASLQSSELARKLMGYVPRHSWRASC